MSADYLDRGVSVKALQEGEEWDVIIIGGGATGLGIAIDSACRGYKTLLLEQSDFAKGTSSRSTKLVHGGVRYMAQGNIRLVYDALHERGLMLQNAAHLVKRQAFIIPVYSWFAKMKYLTGLKLYDMLAGRYSFGKSKFLNREEVSIQLPGLHKKNLAGGILYFDGQFDDARMAVNMAQTASGKGAVLLNYFKVTGFVKTGIHIRGVKTTDGETGKEYVLKSKVVINATGVFVDEVLQMDTPGTKPLVRPSQGVHVVVDKSFLNSDHAVMIPETADGRVLFAVPWLNHVLLGTTDTALDQHSMEPVALDKEVDFILHTVSSYLENPPQRKDVLSVFAGLRPLAAQGAHTGSTKEISRDHKLIVHPSGLITITGGKWTTYRKMAEETVDKAIVVGNLQPVACNTRNIRIHGCPDALEAPSTYGTDLKKIQDLIAGIPALEKRLAAHLPYTEAEVVWAVRYEMARTVEDVLARRLRILFLDAKAAVHAAPRVARLMAECLGLSNEWEKEQVALFSVVAGNYMVHSVPVSNEVPATADAMALSFKY